MATITNRSAGRVGQEHAARSIIQPAVQSLPDGIVECGPDLPDGLVAAIGPGAVGQQDDRNVRLQIDPEGTPAITKMADGVERKNDGQMKNSRRECPTLMRANFLRAFAVPRRVDGVCLEKPLRILADARVNGGQESRPRNGADPVRWRTSPHVRQPRPEERRSRPGLRPG